MVPSFTVADCIVFLVWVMYANGCVVCMLIVCLVILLSPWYYFFISFPSFDDIFVTLSIVITVMIV